MRDLVKILFLLVILATTFIFKDTIANFFIDNVIYNGSSKILTYNEYYLANDYLYVQNTDLDSASNYQDILNIFYTTINSGDDSYSFYCDYNYCIDDLKLITNDNDIIPNINNFVHPYNAFDSINIDIGTTNKISIRVKKIYTKEQIEFINNYINDFISKNINLSMNNYDKIKVFHDHIVNNTKYDENDSFKSHTAYNLIKSGISICNGYSDIMAIYLNAIGVKNYKITSTNHIWNLVELDGTWYHLDMTWDDPIASDGKQYLLHNFFMISTNKLLELDKIEHNFDKNIYLEAR